MELQKLFVSLALKGDEFKQGLEDAGRQAEGLRGKMDGMLAKLAGAAKLAMAGVGLAIAGGFAMAVKSSIEVNAQLETTQLQFETLMGSAEEAEKHVAGLFEFAEKTPFETGPIIKASLKLQTFGGAALNTMENISLLGDAAAATNAPIDELGFWVGRLYANLQAGQPFGEAAARLQEMAVMSPEARTEMERLQKSGASAAEVFAYFQEDLGKFTGAMEKQASTWQGMTSTIKDQITLLLAEGFEPLFEQGKEGLASLIELLNDPAFQDSFVQLAANIGNAVAAIGDATQSFVGFFSAQDQMHSHNALLKDMGLNLFEINALRREAADISGSMGGTVEHERVLSEIIKERYSTELALRDALNARSEAEDYATDVMREAEQETTEYYRNLAREIEAAYTVQETQDGLNQEYTNRQAARVAELTEKYREETAERMAIVQAAAEAEAAAYNAAFQGVLGDFTTELAGADQPLVSPEKWVSVMTGGLGTEQQALLDEYRGRVEQLTGTISDLQNGIGTYGMEQQAVNEKIEAARGEVAHYQALMEPLAAVTGDVSTHHQGLKVNVDAARQAIFDQMSQIPGAEAATVAYGVATGILTREQGFAALQAAQVALKIEELANAMAAGMPIEQAMADFDAFVMKIEGQVIPATEAAASNVPQNLKDMRTQISNEALASGRALGEGYQQGIDETRDDVIAASVQTAEDTIADTKAAYGIQSPSTVFQGIGSDLMAGLEAGIEAGKQRLRNALSGVKDIVGGLVDGVVDLISGLWDTLKALVGEIVDGVIEFFTDLYDRMVGHSIVVDLVEDVRAWFETMLEWIGEVLVNLWTVVSDPFLTMWEELKLWFLAKADEIKGIGSALIGGLKAGIEAGLDELRSILQSVADAIPDWLMEFLGIHSPARATIPIGQAIVEGLIEGVALTGDDLLEAIEEWILDPVLGMLYEWEKLLKAGSMAEGLASGFAGHFERLVMRPMEEQMDSLTDKVEAAGKVYSFAFAGMTVPDFVDDGSEKTLKQLLAVQGQLKWQIKDFESRGVDPAAYQFQLQGLDTVDQAIDAFRLRNDINAEYIQQQEKLLALEKARADLDFLKQQMELLGLMKANNIPLSALDGVTLGLSADPGQLMDIMVNVMEAIVRQTEYEMNNAFNQSPAVSSTTPGVEGQGQTMNVQTQNINGGQHIYVSDAAEGWLEQVEVLAR